MAKLHQRLQVEDQVRVTSGRGVQLGLQQDDAESTQAIRILDMSK